MLGSGHNGLIRSRVGAFGVEMSGSIDGDTKEIQRHQIERVGILSEYWILSPPSPHPAFIFHVFTYPNPRVGSTKDCFSMTQRTTTHNSYETSSHYFTGKEFDERSRKNIGCQLLISLGMRVCTNMLSDTCRHIAHTPRTPGGCRSLVGPWPCAHQALGSVPSNRRKKEQKGEEWTLEKLPNEDRRNGRCN